MSNSDNAMPARQPQVLESIRLDLANGAILVKPEQAGGEGFELPLIKKSLVDRLAYGMLHILLRRQRCVAVLLCLDLITRRWGFGIPRQRAGREASSWSMRKDDFPDMAPTLRVAGSLQVRLLSPGEEPVHAVPPVDGVHLVQIATDPIHTIWSFVHLGSEALLVPGPRIIRDDDAELIQEFEDRTSFL